MTGSDVRRGVEVGDGASELDYLMVRAGREVKSFGGAVQYIFAGGDKNSLTAAKKRISWAIAGFVLLGLLFAISQYVQNIFPQSFHRYPGLPTLHNTIKDITVP